MTTREALAVLGLKENVAVLEDVKPAYRIKVKLLHPDKGGDATKFKQLVEAYETLIGKRRVRQPVPVRTSGWIVWRVYNCSTTGATTATA